MAAPTFAEAWVKLKAAVDLLEVERNAAGVNAANFVAKARSYEEAVKAEGPEATAASNAVRAAREGYRAAILAGRALLAPLIALVAKSSVINSSRTDTQGQIDDVYRYMALNSERITSRQFTRGAFSSGSPYVGNGSVKRVTQDQYGLNLEASFAEVMTCLVTRDANTGASYKGQEIWRVDGLAHVDELEWGVSGRGSGNRNTFQAVNRDNSLLKNAGFKERSGTDALPTELTGWKWNGAAALNGVGTDLQIDSTTANIYQETKKDNGAPRVLRLEQTGVLSQAYSINNIKPSPDLPYFSGIAYNREIGTASGTLVLYNGATSKSLAVAAQTGWNLLELPTTNQSDQWARNFNEQDADWKVDWTRTAGVLRISRPLFCPFLPIVDQKTGRVSSYILFVSGSTPWLMNDTGTITDTEVGAKIQYYLHLYFGRSLPASTGGSITRTDP